MLGYDWPEFHAAVNDLPAALLLVSVLFDLLGTALKRDTLKAAGFWTLVTGVAGAGVSVVSGKLAEETVEHSDQAHAVMETHETLGTIVLVMFGLLAIWRLVRKVLGPREQPVYLTAGVIGVALMVYTARLGGVLVFDHAIGISAARMHQVTEERGGMEHEHAEGEGHTSAPAAADSSTPPDSARPAADSSRTHTHRDGSTHQHN
jgi:uncharacterized membrane protein